MSMLQVVLDLAIDQLFTCKDEGLKVLREAPKEVQNIDIVVIHGLGAYPDERWCKNVGTAEEPQWRNWLIEDDMLPAVAPNARIMRYGYASLWFGHIEMRHGMALMAGRFLRVLKQQRKRAPFRPLVFVTYGFGGLIVLEALLEAEQHPEKWPGIFSSNTGLVLFGTPFRGAQRMKQMEILEAVWFEYHGYQIPQSGIAYLQELVDTFSKKRQGQTNKTQLAWFYESKPSNVGKVESEQDPTGFMIDRYIGRLVPSESINIFENVHEQGFETFADVFRKILKASPQLSWPQSQGVSEHKIDFSLKGVPVLHQFVARDAEMQVLEEALIGIPLTTSHRKVVVVHGLSGVGKTQLVVEFARKHHHQFSAVFWLDGSSKTSLEHSFVDMVQRLPPTELTANGTQILSQAAVEAVEADVAVRECLQWLSMSLNSHWLLIIDNVDSDYHNHNQDDLPAYDVEYYFPHADHGSILITSRLASLQQLGSGVQVGAVTEEQGRAILEINARRAVEYADVVIELLGGLPLALTQAGSYTRETNVTTDIYTMHYIFKLPRLMENDSRFGLSEYSYHAVGTNWTMSYEQVQRQSDGAGCLLKLLGFLDSGEVWYELISACKDLAVEMDVPTSLLEVIQDELAFHDAMRLLSRYSLVDDKQDTESYSMHEMLHRWCSSQVKGKEQQVLGCLAVALVASLVPVKLEVESWRKRKRIMVHGLRVSRWMMDNGELGGKQAVEASIRPELLDRLGNLLADEDLQSAVQMYQRALIGYERVLGADHISTLDTVKNLGILYVKEGKIDLAIHMYYQTLAAYERALGLDHTLTLQMVSSLGILYAEQGEFEQAERMYQRALKGKKTETSSSNTPTTMAFRAKKEEIDLRSPLDANAQTLVSPVENQDQLLSERNDDGVHSQAIAKIGCDCLPATEVVDKPTVRHVLAETAEKLPSRWEEIQDQLPDSYKWDIEFITNRLVGAAENGCWSCTPLLDGEPKQIPLTIAHAPVVIPVEHRWPPVGGVKPPPDPRTSSLINPWAELPMDVVRDLFLTFKGALGFYALISGLLQVIVPDTFETEWASSHLPHSFSGLKVCYIMNTMEPTMLQSNVTVAHQTSATSQTPSVPFAHPSRQTRSAQSLQINDLIEARVSSISRAKFEGRIGLKVAKSEAILSKTFIGLTRNRIKRLQDDWNEHAEIWAGGLKIGTIEKSFDQAAEHYPSGFNHDITLIKPNKDREALIANIQTPIDDLGWLSQDAWSSLRQHSAAIKILGPTGPDKQAKCIKCHTNSEATVVGEGVFLNQTAAAGSKALESHDESFWRKFVSRAVLYRVSPGFDTPNGYSGVALWADGKREDGSQGPGIVGFQSFVQRSGHTQNFNLPEGAHLEERLRKGFVAFYGAFQVPDELRQEYRIL